MKTRAYGAGLVLAAAIPITGCDRTQRDFDRAAEQNTEQAYRDFVKSHGEHPLAKEARSRVEALALDAARKKMSPAALEAFLNEYPATTQRNALQREIEGLLRQRAYRCVSGMPAAGASATFFLLTPGSTDITFGVSGESDKDQQGPYGEVCGLKVRQTVTVVAVEQDGLLRLDREGVKAANEATGAKYISRKVGGEKEPAIVFVPEEG